MLINKIQYSSISIELLHVTYSQILSWERKRDNYSSVREIIIIRSLNNVIVRKKKSKCLKRYFYVDNQWRLLYWRYLSYVRRLPKIFMLYYIKERERESTYFAGSLYKYPWPSSLHRMTLSAAKKSPAIQRSPRGAVIEQRTEKSPASYIYKIIPIIYITT